MTTKPDPPPEAQLIRLVRQAAKISIPAAAKAADMSTSRWSQIEAGYESRRRSVKPVVAKADTIAYMAQVVGLTPDRLAAAGRPDAAEILREILTPKPPPGGPRPEHNGVSATRVIADWLDTYERLQTENPAAAQQMIDDARENIRRIREENERRGRNSA